MKLLKHNRGRNIKNYSDLFLHLETKWHFGAKSAVFECRNFPNAYFSNRILRFSAGIRLSHPADGKKRKGLFLTSKKMGVWSKNVNMNAIKVCEESVFLKLNFVKSLFFSHWILWEVRFSNVEFCEMSENGLNFLPRQTPDIGSRQRVITDEDDLKEYVITK